MEPIAVLGAGSWGTALAILLAQNGQTVRLWGRDAAQMQQCAEERRNIHYLPDNLFPSGLSVSSDLSTVLDQIDDILIAVPSNGFRETLQAIRPYYKPHMHIFWATKGLEPKSSKFLYEVVQEELGQNCLMGLLSGPSFAKEVAAGLPTAITFATTSSEMISIALARFHNHTFRVYTSSDMIGVSLGGTIKNVLAIAAGISDGLGFGSNARAALLTRGLAEMMRLGLALGASQETLMGLSGLGDLILTGTDNQSRNRRFGAALGQGKSVSEAIYSIGQVVEGIGSTTEVYHRAKSIGIDMPITEQVYKVLNEGLPPRQAVENLFSRDPKAE